VIEMNIIVCIKQVPDTTEIKIDPKTGTLKREGVPSIINPEDKNAIEAAVQLKETNKAKVTVLTMGPPQAEAALREALSMGCDEAILLSDRAFAGADTWATANTLSAAIKKIGGYDLILCGRQAIDGDTAQVGPQLAEALGVNQVTYAQEIKTDGKKITVKRSMEDGYEIVETELPALVTCNHDLNKPRYPTLSEIELAFEEKKYKVMTANDIEVDMKTIGLDGSPTNVHKSFTPEPRGKGEFIKGTPQEIASMLSKKLGVR